MLDTIYEKVKAGTALSDAFSEHGSMFPAVYSASLLAGERSGNLDAVIRRYVAYEKVIGAVRKRTIAALIYPAILVTMMLVLIGIIVLRVVPAFSEFYANFDRPLPLSTRIVVGVSNGVVGNLWLLLIGLVARGRRRLGWVQPAGAAGAHRPACCCGSRGSATTLRKFATAQLARTLATLLGGGIPLVNALEIAVRVDEQPISRAGARRGPAAGAGRATALPHALLRARRVPDVAVKMVEVGESTGALQEMLNSLADFYDEEIETEVSRFITLVEPVLLVVMGVVIAIVVLALYMPLFELSSVVGS